MVVASIDVFAEADVRLSRLFKALSHPARLQILRVLIQKQACICGDIVEELPLAQATVSQHLKVLKDAGLIRGNVMGPAVCYCLDIDELERMKALVQSFFEDIQPSCC